MTARVVSKKKKKRFWFLPSYPLYPTATAQAASSLFIAARLRTGPACLSQDPAVDPLTTASDWLTGRKRGIPESRGRERSCEEKLKKKQNKKKLCILSLNDSLNWEIVWREERKKKRKEQDRREQKEAVQTDTHTLCEGSISKDYPFNLWACHHHAHRKQTYRFVLHWGFIWSATFSLTCNNDRANPPHVLCSSYINQ